MTVHLNDSHSSQDVKEYAIRSLINIRMNTTSFNMILSLKDSYYFIEPIFNKEEGNTKVVEMGDDNSMTSYIERVHISCCVES